MNDPKENIKRNIRHLAGIGGTVQHIIGTVVAGSVSESTCDVQPLDGALLKKVRLNADTTTFAGCRITPAIDSDVLVTMLSPNDAFVSMFSNIEKIEYIDDHGCEVVIDEGKICVKNQETKLWQELNNLLTALQSAVIATPAGSGAFDAATVQKIVQVKTNLEKLLC